MRLIEFHEFVADSILAEERIQEKLSYKVEVINREWNISHSILKDIDVEVKRYKPSLITFFTHQNR